MNLNKVVRIHTTTSESRRLKDQLHTITLNCSLFLTINNFLGKITHASIIFPIKLMPEKLGDTSYKGMQFIAILRTSSSDYLQTHVRM